MRAGRARAAFLQMKNMRASPNLAIAVKFRMLSTTVKPVLLYGAYTWRTTAATLKKIQTFINTCLIRILRIQRPETISSRERWKRTKQQPAEDEVPQRSWRWIGHTLRKPMTCITRQSPDLEPTGKEKARPPKKHLTPRSRG